MAGHRARHLSALALLATLSLVVLGCAAAAPAAPLSRDPPQAEAPGSAPGDEQQGSGPGTGPGDGQQALRDGTHIVRTGSLRLELTELAPALDAAHRLVRDLGGYISNSQERNDAQAFHATITYRVPVERWDEALSGLRALGERVISENTEAADVTAEVVDLDARLVNLRATEAALQAIMDRANTIDDVLKVQRELTTVRGSIESLTAQRDRLVQRAAMATITVSYEVRTTAVGVAAEGWDLGREVDLAVAALVTIGQRLASVGVWVLIVVLPLVVPIGLLGLAWLRFHRARQNHVTMGGDEARR